MDVSIKATAILTIVKVSVHVSMTLIISFSNASSQRVSVLMTVLLTDLGTPFDSKSRVVLVWLIEEVLSTFPTRALCVSLTRGQLVSLRLQ